jgi:hypothetical protein
MAAVRKTATRNRKLRLDQVTHVSILYYVRSIGHTKDACTHCFACAAYPVFRVNEPETNDPAITDPACSAAADPLKTLNVI